MKNMELIKRKGLLCLVLTLTIGLVFMIGVSSQASAQTPVSKDPIKIGWIGPLSGVAADDGGRVLGGSKLAFEEVNWRIAGRKIELIAEDSTFNPGVAVAKLKKLYYDDKIKILIGPYSSASCLAIRDFYDSNKLLTVSTMGGAGALTKEKFSKYFFRLWNISDQLAPFEGLVLYQMGYRNIASFAPDFVAGRDVIAGIKKSFEKLGGKVDPEVYFPIGKTMDFSPLLAKIDMNKTDAVFAWAFGTDAVRFVKQYAEYGYKKLPILSDVITYDSFLQAQGDAALGSYNIIFYAHTLGTAENERFKKSYADVHGGDSSRVFTLYDAFGYSAAKVVVKGIQAVKGNVEDVEGLVQAVERLEFETPMGPFKFYQHSGVNNIYLFRVDRVGDRLLNVPIRAWGPVRQGWFEDGVKIPEISVPGK